MNAPQTLWATAGATARARGAEGRPVPVPRPATIAPIAGA
jgi:hypothetical protein